MIFLSPYFLVINKKIILCLHSSSAVDFPLSPLFLLPPPLLYLINFYLCLPSGGFFLYLFIIIFHTFHSIFLFFALSFPSLLSPSSNSSIPFHVSTWSSTSIRLSHLQPFPPPFYLSRLFYSIAINFLIFSFLFLKPLLPVPLFFA